MSQLCSKKVWIKNIATYLPERIITNDQLIEDHQLRMKSDWVEKRIGITERHWAAENQAASDLAVEAVKTMKLENFAGPIWVSTISADYYTPSTASIVKGKLGFTDRFPAIDLNAACSGQLFALEAASNWLKCQGKGEALVIATEVRSKFLNKHDRRTAFLFGDGACAFHLSIDEADQAPGEVEWVLTQTVPSPELEILVPHGGSVAPYRPGDSDFCPTIKMQDGESIFQQTTQVLTELVKETLAEKNLGLSDFDFFVFHQGNGAIIRTVCDNLRIPMEQTWVNFDRFGNTSSASMGIALWEAQALGKIKRGDRLLLMTMGAGHHIGMSSVVWGK